jgi:ATP-dependent helicase/nuclease subunit A
MTELADREARERAATVKDRNLVVTAGAGTGKTTLLVDRLVHLLFQQPEPLPIGAIVALTFTNKAASEMKLRLRDRLALWVSLDPSTPPRAASRRRDWELMNAVLAAYDLSKAKLNDQARLALLEMEKSQIGTIHSFAAHLLRLYPQEGAVDPEFVEDDGTRFAEYLEREWGLWLDGELGTSGAHQDVWRAALAVASLEEIRELAARLCSELIPLDEVAAQLLPATEQALPDAIRRWVGTLATRAALLRQAHAKTNTLERMLDAAIPLLEGLAEGRGPERTTPVEAAELGRGVPGQTKAWSDVDYAEARDILRTAQALRCVNLAPVAPLLDRLVRFAERCRGGFVAEGFLSFDGLLARARNLLRDHPSIRRALKAQFRAILVDEFQDTDPVQYELILYLAEAAGAEAAEWREVRLAPGKLFIVGDPKQSIYAFRRADMEAYDAVVDELILGQAVPGERQTLQTNFRGHPALLDPINACFSRLFPARAIKGIQPGDEPLLPLPTGPAPLPHERVEIRLVRPDEAEADTETATRCEAEELARWLAEEVLGRQQLREGEEAVAIKPKHVAILFRTLTYARDYLEALRRYGIPYLTEGEKHFYERQEVVDCVNLLLAAADPHDRIALVGVLRSPLGGLRDREIEQLARLKRLDFRLDPPDGVAAAPTYALLRELHAKLPRLPVIEAINLALARAPLLELAAASVDGEQAMANLRKLRDLILELAGRADLSWRAVLAHLVERVREAPDEAESPLAEERLDEVEGEGAVRVLSIHKAKGLEFPLVLLAGLHRGVDRREGRVLAQHDWSTGLVGLRVGDCQTYGGVYVSARLTERQRAEQRRVLYVAMTRAKRRLVLSAGIPANTSRMGDSLLVMVGEGIGRDLRSPAAGTEDPAGPQVTIEVVTGREVPLTRSSQEEPWTEGPGDLAAQAARWDQRTRRWEVARTERRFLTVSEVLKSQARPPRAATPRSEEGAEDRSRRLGVLVHRILADWDFTAERGARLAQPPMSGEADPGDELGREIRDILTAFAGSETYRELQRATILGREIPFVMPWEGDGQWAMGDKRNPHSLPIAPRLAPLASPCVMEGVIDLIYRLDGDLWVADYKTDRVSGEELVQRAGDYGRQVRIYAQAVAQALGQDRVRAQVIFLRAARAVEVD